MGHMSSSHADSDEVCFGYVVSYGFATPPLVEQIWNRAGDPIFELRGSAPDFDIGP